MSVIYHKLDPEKPGQTQQLPDPTQFLEGTELITYVDGAGVAHGRFICMKERSTYPRVKKWVKV